MKDASILETLSAHSFETTLDRLLAAIAQAGLTFSVASTIRLARRRPD